MSFSRWGNSCWYTFWCASDATKREDEVFSVCGIRDFTYRDLVEDGLDVCIKELKKRIKEQNKDPKNKFGGGKYTEQEYEELKGYMKVFIDEVKKQYNTPSQRYRDGELTLEDAFIEEV